MKLKPSIYNVYFSHAVEKEFTRLDFKEKKRLFSKVKKLKSPFKSHLDIKQLKGVPGFWRLRMGKIRVIFEIDKLKKEVWIRKIGVRGGIYRMF